MNFKNDYIKTKYKYSYLRTNLLGGSGKDTICIFFNGGGLDHTQWVVHPYKNKNPTWINRKGEYEKTDLIEKIKKICDVYLYTPVFYNINKHDISNGKKFKLEDLDLTNHCKDIYNKINKYEKIIVISHSRGFMLSKIFCSLYEDKIIGYINIDAGETEILYKKKLDEWKNKYENINAKQLDNLFEDVKKDDKTALNTISGLVNYHIYKQGIMNKYNYNKIKMVIMNNIYDDDEISIKDSSYVSETLIPKFIYNKQFSDMKNVKSIYYVGKSHFLYFYSDVVDDIIHNVKKFIKADTNNNKNDEEEKITS